MIIPMLSVSDSTMSKRCRICLCLKPRRDLTELEITEGTTEHSYEEIILFCLNIKVDEDSKLGRKLCVKCHRKILDFYDFKTMAIKNNTIRNETADNKQEKAEPEVYVEVADIKLEGSDNELPDEEVIDDIKTEESNEQCDNDVQNENSSDENEIEQSYGKDKVIENIKEEEEENTENSVNAQSIQNAILPTQKKIKTKVKQTCSECGESVSDLKRHMFTHLPPEEKQNVKVCKSKSSGFCKECGKYVNRLQDHMVMHLPDDIWKKQRKGAGLAGTCKVCGKTVKRLKKHMVLHLPEFQREKKKSTELPVKVKNKGPVKCLMCSREFTAQQYLDLHMKNLHLRPKKQCPLCDKEVNKLKMHMLTAHNRDQLKYECGWCGTRHATRYILEKHIAIHMNNRPFHCNECDKKFIQRAALLQHQRQIHLKIRQYLCQFCSKTFCSNANLKVHVRGAHTKERPFKCTDCGKGFNTKHLLKSHIDNVHTNVKNYACTHCPKRYKTQIQVTRHYKESHLKIKNYKCRFCDSRFYRSSHMKRHEYTIHLRLAPGKTDD